MQRLLIPLAVIVLAALAVWHPAPRAPLAALASASPSAPDRPSRRRLVSPGLAGAGLVYVVGAVARPGLYRIAAGARIEDAVRAAGGLRADADPAAVNLAAHLSDGDEIAVPVLGEVLPRAVNTKRTRSSRARTSKTHAIVNVNSASAAELASVPGIGATIAARIVEIREQDGVYATFDELLDVAGMTQSRLERAQPFLRL